MASPHDRPLSAADRPPPYNPEAEDSVIGSCLHDPTMIDEVADMISPADFFQASRQIVWSVIVAMVGCNKPVDGVTLIDELVRLGEFAKIGGHETIRQICEAVPHAANAKYYAGIVREKSIGRGLIEASTETLRECYSAQFTASELVCSAEERVFAIAERDAGGTVVGMDISVDEAMARMQIRKSGELIGVFTGFVDLDEYFGGLQPGQLVILAARPSQGKTALALDISRSIAAMEERVLFFSLEMSRAALTDRLIASTARVPLKKVRRPDMQSRQDEAEIHKAATIVHRLPIRIDDVAGRNLTQMAAIARREKRRYGLSLIVVDYLSLIDGHKEARDNREQEVARISRGLKAIGKNIGVPVLALQQLNRKSEERSDHRPKMHDLRESGQIEQDADIIMLLHRPEKYDPNDRPGEADVDIAKNRDGETGVVTLAFQSPIVRFDNLARRDQVPPDKPPF